MEEKKGDVNTICINDSNDKWLSLNTGVGEVAYCTKSDDSVKYTIYMAGEDLFEELKKDFDNLTHEKFTKICDEKKLEKSGWSD